ncbi:hypothetical protein ES703_68165 [subsurface metagenome]
MDFISLYWHGNNTGLQISLRFFTGTWENQFEYVFIDSWTGWTRFMIPLDHFKVHVGSPNWEEINTFSIVFLTKLDRRATFYLDRLTADTGVHELIILPIHLFATH